MVTLLTEIKFRFNYFEQKLKRKMQLAKTIPNHTTISVTEMVVCNRDWWVNRNKKKINLTSLQSLKGRWVNRNETCIKINLSN